MFMKLSKRDFAIISIPDVHKEEFLDAITQAVPGQDRDTRSITQATPATGTWEHQEPSYIIPKISLKEAINLAKKYDQEAIIYNHKLYNLKNNTVTPASSISVGNIPDAKTKSFIDLDYEFPPEKISKR